MLGTTWMMKWLKGVAAATAALALAAPVQAQSTTQTTTPYTKLVMFGDSMTDTHRWFDFLEATIGRGSPNLPSMPGRFSNGKVSSEILAELLGVPLQNYSFSGATTGYRSLVVLPMGVLTQVNEYLTNNEIVPIIKTVPVLSDILSLVTGTGKADPNALYVIWSGPDDYYFIGGFNATTAYTAAGNIQQAVNALYRAGARHFFIPTMPDLAITPSARYAHEPKEPGYMARAAKYSKQFHEVLTIALANLRQRYPQASIKSFDTMAFTNEQLPLLVADGFNITDSCIPMPNSTQPGKELCTTPEKYLFWDSNHLTAEGNRRLAEAWFKAVSHQP